MKALFPLSLVLLAFSAYSSDVFAAPADCQRVINTAALNAAASLQPLGYFHVVSSYKVEPATFVVTLSDFPYEVTADVNMGPSCKVLSVNAYESNNGNGN